MKRLNFLIAAAFAAIIMISGAGVIYAQTSSIAQNNNDVPYLSADDIAAIEMVLPGDALSGLDVTKKAAELSGAAAVPNAVPAAAPNTAAVPNAVPAPAVPAPAAVPAAAPAAVPPKPVVQEIKNEITRLNTTQSVYHLLVLDRTRSPANSDISDVGNLRILYKYKHGKDGYLVAVYVSPASGPVFPQLPARSRIILDFATAQKATIRDYVNSAAFHKYVTNRKVISDLQNAVK
ncbi:MAG: hypothetical protein FWD78_07010 [Treponema sp.]|nr:hypothetical protein [Treponema sp.]